MLQWIQFDILIFTSGVNIFYKILFICSSSFIFVNGEDLVIFNFFIRKNSDPWMTLYIKGKLNSCISLSMAWLWPCPCNHLFLKYRLVQIKWNNNKLQQNEKKTWFFAYKCISDNTLFTKNKVDKEHQQQCCQKVS